MQHKIDALKQAAAWPGTGQRTLVVLANQLVAAGLYQEGLKYFAPRSDAAPADALWRAPAGAFEFRLDGRTGEAIAKLDAATSLDLALPHYFRGTSLARVRGPRGDRRRRPQVRARGQGPVPAWLDEVRIGGADSVH